MSQAVFVFAGLFSLVAFFSTGAARAAEPVPVVVELFTSEGCSSCPPADKLLNEFSKASPVPGAAVIPLSYHVDYWDGLGWPDPYASKQWTDEQNATVTALGGASLYTPQMVVDGRVDFVGSDRAAATKQITAAGRHVKLNVTLNVKPGDAKSVDVTVRVESPTNTLDGPADVVLVVTEDGLTTQVRRGENAGRRLEHDGVVRWSKSIGTLSKNVPAPFKFMLPADGKWNLTNTHVIALVRSTGDRHILGAATVRWPAP